MNNQKIEEAKYLLRKMIFDYGEEYQEDHRWFWEGERWNELVFSLLSEVSNLSELDVRLITEKLDELQLLNIASLAKLDPADRHRGEGVRILEVMQEGCFSDEAARRGLVSICEAARVIQEHFGGKIQHYLRHYGQMMLQDVREQFHFTEMKDKAVNRAFSYWLQNVLSMPVSLKDAYFERYCESRDLKPADVIAAADELDVNVGLVDDLVQRYMLELAEEKERRSAAKIPEPIMSSS